MVARSKGRTNVRTVKTKRQKDRRLTTPRRLQSPTVRVEHPHGDPDASIAVPASQPRPPRPHGAGARRIHVLVTTYNRHSDMLRLACDLATWSAASAHAITVSVYDDGSTESYAGVADIVRRCGWRLSRSRRPHGKRGYARWLTDMLATERRRQSADLYVVLQDDVRLSTRFFDRLVSVWDRLGSHRPGTLQLLRDDSRTGLPCWTGVVPEDMGSVTRTGWVDCLFAASPAAIDHMIQHPPTFGADRWADDPTRSSGFGEHHSRSLLRAGFGMFCARHSLIAHVGLQSQLNPQARRKNAMLALDFVDGERVHQSHLGRTAVVASMASIPSRAALLPRVVGSLLPQVHELRVYLNGYDRVPSCLQAPRVTVVRSQDQGDKGDAGKFHWIGQSSGYVLTCDDDILYPGDYVGRMIAAIERHGRRAVVSCHGASVPTGVRLSSYFGQRLGVVHYLRRQRHDARVHVPGTGVAAFHTDTISLSPRDFPTRFMADIHLAVAARRQRVPVYAIAHAEGWLSTLEPDDGRAPTLYARYVRDDGPQTAALNSVGPW